MKYDNLWGGSKPSPCPLPCTTTYTDTRLLSNIPAKLGNTSFIDLHFSNTMKVTTTDFLPFYLTTLLADLGGSMGLWLGLGVLQVIQLLLSYMVTAVRTKT